jgi:hypothetical protein
MNDSPDGIGEDARRRIAEMNYPGKGHCWADFLHHRARVIDWLYAGKGADHCKGNDAKIAKNLSMDTIQVYLIRMRDRSLDHG